MDEDRVRAGSPVLENVVQHDGTLVSEVPLVMGAADRHEDVVRKVSNAVATAANAMHKTFVEISSETFFQLHIPLAVCGKRHPSARAAPVGATS